MAKRNNLIISIFLITISIFLLLGINKTIKDHHDRQYTVVYNKIKDIINPNDFKSEANQKIMRRLYEEFEKGNSNINSLVDMFADDEQVVNALTGIMADDYEIEDNKKALDDVINNYQKEKLMARRNEIIQSLNNASLDKEKASELEKELHTLIIKLAQIK